jgi:lipoprotein NlpI
MGAALRQHPGMKLLLALLLTVLVARAEDAASTETARREMLAGFEKEIAALDAAIRSEPEKVSLYSRRGDRQLFVGKFAAAIADFEKMIALDPTQDAPHWRLGIAYHFAGQWEKSARQFEKYHAYDARDRENGIWKFLADVRLVGLEKARTQMLEYTRFDREPFPTLYDMFAGKKTTDELFQHVAASKLTDNGAVMFFAHYYGGLNELLLGRKDRARELLAKAVASPWGQTAEGGPAYMWQCARLHYEALPRL